MEYKKNPKYDLEKKKGTFLNLGLTISILLVIIAFEFPDRGEEEIMDFGEISTDFDDILEIPPTTQPPPPPPPKIQIPEIVEVPDEEEIEEEVEVELDVEITEETVVEDIIFSDEPAEEEVDEILTIVEEQPEFPGGNKAFGEYLAQNLKYPPMARRMGVQGRVYVQFTVGKDGALTDMQVVKGIGSGCDEEAIRVLKMSPNFNPGKQRGMPVRVRMTIPIYFKLSN